MGLLVISEASPRGEAFGAQRAGKGPLAGVCPFVLYKVPPLNEAAATPRALMGLLGGVSQSVPPQAAELGVADAAVGAGVRLLTCVNPLVRHHVYLLGEVLPAHRAAVQFDTRVHGHVVDQPRRAGKFPPAY